jgi:uncharacterized RDD family membrane protein YckC
MTDVPDYSTVPGQAPRSGPTGPAAASVGIRFVARLVDFVILGVVNAVLVGALLVGAILGESGGMFMGAGASGLLASAIGAVLGAVINLAYFAVLESRRGQTVGKMVTKLRVVDDAGRNPTLEQAIRRNIWVACGIAGIVPIIGGLVGSLAQLVAVITIAVGISDGKSGGRGWHDRFAGGTLVVPEGAIDHASER